MKYLIAAAILGFAGILNAQTVQMGSKKTSSYHFKSAIACSQSGSYVAALNTARKDISVYETFKGNEIARITENNYVSDIYFLNETTLLCVSGFRVEIIDILENKITATFNYDEFILESSFCLASGQLLMASAKELVLIQVRNTEIVILNRKKLQYARQLNISENGNYASARYGDKIVCYALPLFTQKFTLSAKNVKSFSAGNQSVMLVYTAPFSFAYFDYKGKRMGDIQNFTVIPEPFGTTVISMGNGFVFDAYKRIVFISEEGNQTIIKTSESFSNFGVCKTTGKIFTANQAEINITDVDGNLFCRISEHQIIPFEMFYFKQGNKYIFINDTVLLFKTAEGTERRQITGSAAIVGGQFSEGNLILKLADGTVQFWDTEREKLVQTLNTTHIPFAILWDTQNERAYFSDYLEKAFYGINLGNGLKELIAWNPSPVSQICRLEHKIFTGNVRGDIVKYGYDKTGKILQEECKVNVFGNGISLLMPNSNQLLVASYGRMAFINADLGDSARLHVFIGHNGYIGDVLFLNNEKYFLSAAEDRTIKLWNRTNYRLLQSYELDSVSAKRLQVLSKSEVLFFGSEFIVGAITDSITILNDEKPQGEIVLQTPNSNAPLKLAMNQDGTLLAAEDGGSIKVRDLKSGFLLSEFTSESKVVNGFAFTTDGHMLAVASGNSVECFDPLSGKSIRKIDVSKRGYPGNLGGTPAFLAGSIHDIECYNNAILAINNFGWHNPMILHKNSGLNLGQINFNPTDSWDNTLLDLKCMPDGKWLVTLGNNYLKVFSNVEKMELKWVLTREGKGLTNKKYIDFVDLDGEGNYLLFVDFDPRSKCKILDLKTGRIVQNNYGGIGAFGKNGKYIYAYYKDRLGLRTIDSDSFQMLDVKFDSEINNIIYNDKRDIFVVSDIWGNIKTLDGRSFHVLSEINRWDQYTYNTRLSANGKYLLFNNRFGLYTVDLRNLKREVIQGNNYPLSAVFSPINDILYYRQDSTFYSKDLNTGEIQLLFTASIKPNEFKGMQISSDGRVLYWTNESDDVYFYNIEDRKLIYQLNCFKLPGLDGLVMRDVIVENGNTYIRGIGLNTYNKKTGVKLVEMPANSTAPILSRSKEIVFTREGSDGFDNLIFERDLKVFELTSDNQYLVYMQHLNLYILDNKTGDTIFIRDNPVSGSIQSARFSPDYKYFVIGLKDGFVEIYNFEKYKEERNKNSKAAGLKLIKSFKANAMGIDRMEMANGLLLINGSNAFTSVFNLKENFEKQLDMDFIRHSEQIFINKEGYYYSTKSALNYIAYKQNTNVYPIDQMDLIYNRPDKVLGGLNDADTNLVSSYYKAHLKRLKKHKNIHFSENRNMAMPEVEIANRLAIPYEVSEARIKLNIRAFTPDATIHSINIFVNNIPVFGINGLVLRLRYIQKLDTNLGVLLSSGINKIEVVVVNSQGAENFKSPLFVHYASVQPKDVKVYFIGIGMNKFANANYNLNFSRKDILDLADSLSVKYAERLIIDTLFNEKVTLKNIRELKKKLLQTDVNDKVIVAYSGHGLLSKDFDYYLSTYSVDFEHPEKNGLPYETLENLLDSIPARQKLMLIDACHSGEVDKDELVRIKAEAKELGLKGVDVVAYEGAESGLGLQNSFELMQSLFVNVGKGTGATIISASAGTQFALENGNLKNGVFTYCILEALALNPSMTVSKLKETVGKRVVEITHGMQQPTSRNETIYADWYIW